MSKIYKHIKYNLHLQKIDWVLEQVDDTWKLKQIIQLDPYEAVAIFERELK